MREETPQRTTIKDIARECGVSLSTVSLVLNDNPRISESTRRKVQDAVRRFGYQPNHQARGLASRSSRMISVVVPDLNHVFADIYFGEIVSGIHDRATEADYKILLDVANERFLNNKEHLNLFRSRRADGMLFIASSIHHKYLLDFENEPHPFLLVNHYFPNSKLNYIAVDYKESARLAADHLVSLGHRAIGVIAGTNTHTGLDFRDTFLAHCRSLGLTEEDTPWVDGGPDWSQENGFMAARRLLDRHGKLTAIMAANDRLAMGAISYLRTKDIKVPQDVSVMGLDNIPLAEFFSPALTTVHHDLFQIGRVAFDRILGIFRGDISSCQEVLPVKLIKRESTGPAPARS